MAFFLFASLQGNAQCPNSNRSGIHVIQSGDNLYRIAQTYGIQVDQLLSWNNLGYNQPILLCQELRISNSIQPPQEYNTRPTETFTSRGGTYQKQSGKRHQVQPGQTMAGLAELYGYSEARFREFNAMTSNDRPQTGDLLLSSDCTCDRISYNSSNTDYAGVAERGFTSSGWREVGGTSSGWREVGGSSAGRYTGTSPTNTNPTTSTTPTSNPIAGAGTTSMNSKEMEMVNEINLLRSNPSGYIQYVNAYVAEQRRTNGFPVDQSVVNELNSELQQLSTLSRLTPLQCIYTAAKNHGIDQKPTGDVNHQGTDGAWPWDRVRRACPDLQDGNENLVAGTPSVRTAVILLLIDEGIPTRGHRKTLLKPEWKYVACYNVGTVGSFPHYWVQKFGY